MSEVNINYDDEGRIIFSLFEKEKEPKLDSDIAWAGYHIRTKGDIPVESLSREDRIYLTRAEHLMRNYTPNNIENISPFEFRRLDIKLRTKISKI